MPIAWCDAARTWTPRRPAVGVAACVVCGGLDASATGGGGGRVRGSRRAWTPRRPAVASVARTSCTRRAGSAAKSAWPGRATTRLMRPPPFAVGSGRRTSGGVRTPAVIHQQAVECGQRNPSLGERPAV